MRTRKKLFRILIWFLIIFFLLLVALAVFSQTAPFRSIVARIITDQAEKFINGELSIGSIEGNFYNGLTFKDIIVKDGDLIVLSLKELSLHYSLLPLLRKQVIVTNLLINELFVALQEEEGVWNLERLLITEESENQSLTEEKVESAWEISVTAIELRAINVSIDSRTESDLPLPSGINDLFLKMSFDMRPGWMSLQLQDAGFKIDWQNEHQININRISLTARMIEENFELREMILDSDNFILTASGRSDFNLEDFAAELDLYVQHAVDFAYFYPEIRAESTFRLTADVNGLAELLELSLLFREDTGKLEVEMEMINPPYHETDLEAEYNITILFEEFKPSYWLAEESLFLSINGDISLQGKGFDPYEGVFSVETDLRETIIRADEFFENELYLDRFVTVLELDKSDLKGDLVVQLRDFGLLRTNAAIGNIEELTDFQVQGELIGLNLESFDDLDNPSSNLNLRFNIQGEHTTDSPIYAELEVLPSRFGDITIETVQLRAMLENEEVTLDTLFCDIGGNLFEATGFFSQERESNADYILHINNLKPLLTYLELPEDMIETEGKLSGHLQGKLDDLILVAELVLNEPRYEDIYSDKITGSFFVTMKEEFILVWLETNAYNILIGEIPLERVTAFGNLHQNRLSISLDARQSEDVTFNLESDIVMNEEILVALDKLQIKLEDDTWKLSENRALINISDETFTFTDFVLKSGEQNIDLEGVSSLKDRSNLRFSIDRFDITSLSALIDDIPFSSGNLDLDFQLQGMPDSPEIVSDTRIYNLSWEEVSNLSSELSLTYNPQNQYATTDIRVLSEEEPYAFIDATIPLLITLNGGFELYEDRDFHLNFWTNDLELSLVDDFVEDIRGLSGILRTNLTLSNTINDIRAEGSLKLIDVRLSVPELGTSYRNLNLDLLFEDDILNIDRLAMRSGQGRFNGKGSVTLGSDIIKRPSEQSTGQVTLFDLQFDLEDFPLINTRALNLISRGRLQVNGSLEEPRVRGNIVINRGRINLDELLDLIDETGEEPLLVEARRKIFAAEEYTTDEVEEESNGFTIDRLRGELTVSFPRNVWIRSSDMNLEISADLTIIIEGGEFEIFGNVSTIRGYYAFYGKRFQIVTGDVVFGGGSEINPQLALEAIYSFRGQDLTRNNLRLLVSGTMEEMELAFELNDQPIDEADAISYIILGRSFDELTQGEKNEVSDQALAIGGLLANRLTDQIATVIGDSFSLDVIEFRSDTATSQVGIEIGKYLTDNLFISYKRDFSFSDTKEPVSEEILVEYEITRFLYLQLVRVDAKDTGMDLIWRYKWR